MKKNHPTLEEKIRASGKAFFDKQTQHLEFKRPLKPASMWWQSWGFLFPTGGALGIIVTVLVAILIGSTQPNSSFNQAFTGIYALNQVSYPPYSQRDQAEDFLEGKPSYDQYRQDVSQFFRLTAPVVMDGNTNITYSPLSAYVALSLLLEAANGATYDALVDVLNVTDLDQFRRESEHAFIDTYLEVNDVINGQPTTLARSAIANGVFIKENVQVKADYLSLLGQQYFAEVFETAFDQQGLNDISRWLNQRTFGFLDIPPNDLSLNQDTVISLFNAFYLKANWRKPFPSTANTLGSFTNRSTGAVLDQVTYMNKVIPQTLFVDQPEFTLTLDQAYGDHRVVYVLPKNNLSPTELLQGEYYPRIQAAIESTHQLDAVALSLPKSSSKNRLDLKASLLSVAPSLAPLFDPATADLSNALPEGYVQSLLQHTKIDFFEAGFEAAAITEANIGVTSIPSLPTHQLHLNESYLYLIVNGQGLILFAGVIHQPTF
jgi:serpin B